MYVLVILKDGRNAEAKPLHAAAHETFISSLIKRNVVLLGGAFADAVDDAFAAYLLRCDDVDEARRIAAEDPLAVNDVVADVRRLGARRRQSRRDRPLRRHSPPGCLTRRHGRKLARDGLEPRSASRDHVRR